MVLYIDCFWLKYKKIKSSFDKYIFNADVEGSGYEYPMVLILIPICNEKEVYEQSISAVCQIDWPKDHFLVQVLDDSNDENIQWLIKAEVSKWSQRGIIIFYKHHLVRTVYKAKNLKSVMRCDYVKRYEFVAIFDADFQPNPDFLKQTVTHFKDNSELGLVQARWSFVNKDVNLLTRLQNVNIYFHFEVEQQSIYITGDVLCSAVQCSVVSILPYLIELCFFPEMLFYFAFCIGAYPDMNLQMGDPSIEVTDESRDESQMAKSLAMEALAEASAYIKMKILNAAIRDANAALEDDGRPRVLSEISRHWGDVFWLGLFIAHLMGMGLFLVLMGINRFKKVDRFKLDQNTNRFINNHADLMETYWPLYAVASGVGTFVGWSWLLLLGSRANLMMTFLVHIVTIYLAVISALCFWDLGFAIAAAV
ncbi:hypothetical protein GIB67_013637 [Kingdonia uniflora]|uniref:Glycosyltransferase 2-like domain-containing protein n=1 Tax=Kingdonia uniflora TaxID=39325 RepID=A0A7J7NPR8_9MAGN|nr:hypothetical protein GIB67_013637 [Kingdonia uniflora]